MNDKRGKELKSGDESAEYEKEEVVSDGGVGMDVRGADTSVPGSKVNEAHVACEVTSNLILMWTLGCCLNPMMH